jgi:pyruvate-formate lyase-activating enzyme
MSDIPVSAVVRSGPGGVAPVLQVHPTRRCHLACAHCYASSGPGAPQALELAMLSACLADAVALGYRQLVVSGGEPLLYEPLSELLAGARALGMRTAIVSSGTLATATRWGWLAPLIDTAAVAIDGTPSEHDAAQRSSGAFVAAVKNLEALRGSGVPFGLRFTLTQHNVDSLDFVVHLAARYGAHSVEVHPLAHHGRATDQPPERPDGGELSFALLEAARLGRELGVPVVVDALGADQLRAQRAVLVPTRPVDQLAAAVPHLIVDADATVLPLTHQISPRFALGSLVQGRLLTLARRWLRAGRADALVESCARTWAELTASPKPAVHWYDEVAVRTRRPPPAPRMALRACV